MRTIISVLSLVPLLCACQATQQIAESAANNAKPAMAPVLSERPPSSSTWSTESGKFYIGAKLFSVGVSHNLFNHISVTLGGQEAIELPRGSWTDFRPIDRSQLQIGKVYYRITGVQSDANAQTEVDMLEVVDNVLRAAGVFPLNTGIVEEQDLTVRETSINPRYAGTADEKRETTVRVSFSRMLSGPPGQGWMSHCAFSFPQGFSQTARGGLAGERVTYGFSTDKCKRVGVLRDGVRSNVVEFADDSARFGNFPFDIPANATPGSTINFQFFGEDLLKRVSYFNAMAVVQRPPPPKPCPTNNGNAGNMIQFRFCGICGEERVPVQNFACSAAEGQQAATNSLSGRTNCTLVTGDCPICPITTENPAGQVQAFTFCIATPAGAFAWNISEVTQGACKKDDAKNVVQVAFSDSVVTEGTQQAFPICTACPGQTPRRDDINACTESQAIDMQKAQFPTCTVARCP